jgi:AcrR family transcriptional regulator
MARKKDSGPAAAVRDQVREDILAAAEAVFSQEGLQAAKVGDIAKRAGVAVGTLYNYFADRDAIVRALLEARSAQVRERLAAAVAGEGEFGEHLRLVVGAMLDTLHENWRFVALMMQSEMLSRMPGAQGKPATNALARETLERLSTLMERGIEQGVLKPGPPRLYALALMSMVRSVVLAPLYGADELQAVSSDQLVALFLYGATEEGLA